MQIYTTEKLKALLDRTGHQLTLADLPAIVELDAIADEIAGAVKARLAGSDVFYLGGRYFTKPTFLRAAFIDRVQGSHRTEAVAIAGVLWALDMEHGKDDLVNVPTRRELLAYRDGLDCTAKEMADAIAALIKDGGDEPDKPQEEINQDRICCILAREIGGAPSEWMDAPPGKLEAAFRLIDERMEAEARAVSGSGRPPTPTPKLMAVKRFRDKIAELEATWLAT